MSTCKQNVADKLRDVISVLYCIGLDAADDERYVDLATDMIAECVTELEKENEESCM